MDGLLTNYNTAYVPSEEGRYVTKHRLQCGLLVVWVTMANSLQVPFSSASSTHGTTKRLPCTITSFPQQLQQGRHWAPILKDTWIRCSVHSAEEALKSKQKIQLQLENDIMISWEPTGWKRRIKTAAYRILMHWRHCMSPWVSLVHHSRREVTSLWDTVCSSLVHLVLWTFKLSWSASAV